MCIRGITPVKIIKEEDSERERAQNIDINDFRHTFCIGYSLYINIRLQEREWNVTVMQKIKLHCTIT